MKKIRHLVVAVSVFLGWGGSALAASSATLQVSAMVLPFVSFQAVQHVASYHVSSADIERGYLDLPASLTVQVRTNVTAGVPVTFENSGGARVLIRETGRSDFMDSFFTLNTDAYRPNTPISKKYDFRVLLPQGSKDGTYPLAISMAPTI